MKLVNIAYIMLQQRISLVQIRSDVFYKLTVLFQKMNIPVDTCMLDRDSSLLQQGADITGGLYVKVPNIDSLFQFLVWIFLPDASSLRKQMGMPSAAKVHLF